MILELMAWAVRHVETFQTKEEAQQFFKELRENREATRGIRPWRGIQDDERFCEHVLAITDTCANSNGPAEAMYPNRTHQPLDDKNGDGAV
jgi:hypothetical protein